MKTLFAIKLCFTFILILLSFTGIAQEIEQNGFIITLKNDTIQGYIRIPSQNDNFKKINFQPNNKVEKTTLSPIEIKSFHVSGSIYESAIVQTEIGPLGINSLKPEADLKLTMDTVFLQKIIDGDKNLYYYKNYIGNKQFYIKTNDDFEFLTYKKFLYQGNAVSSKRYIGQLRLYFKNNSDVLKEVNKTEYTKKSLKKLFQLYYKNSNTNHSHQHSDKKITTEFGLLAGVTITNLKFGNDEIAPHLSKAGFDKSLNPTGGLFVEFNLPTGKRRWSIYSDLLFTKFNFEGQYYSHNTEYFYKYSDSKLTLSHVKLTNMLIGILFQ